MPDLTTETPTYYCILTDAGAALEAAAHQQGKTVNLRTVSVGDGNGTTPTPDKAATALVHENYRKAIDSLTPDPDNDHICWVHMLIPADVGDWYIREVGIWADPLEEGGEPVLYAVGNHPDFYKPKTVMGQAMTHELSLGIVVSSTANVTMIVTDEGYATKIEVEAVRDELRGNALNDVLRAKELIRLTDRLTRHELAALEPCTNATSGGSGLMPPAGYMLGGATVAPVSIIGTNGVAPTGAALVLQVEEVATPDSATL